MKLDLDTLCEQKKPVYVKNKTGGRIIISLTDPISSKARPLEIPPTFAPFPLHERFTHEMLQHSLDLRNHLSNDRILQLMDPEDAEAELLDPETRDELRAAKQTLYTNRSINPADVDREIEQARKAVRSAEAITDVKGETIQINGRVQGIVRRVETEDLSIRDGLTELKRLGNMTKNDLAYVLKQSPAGIIREWAKDQLANMSGKEEEPRPAPMDDFSKDFDVETTDEEVPGQLKSVAAVKKATEEATRRIGDLRRGQGQQ